MQDQDDGGQNDQQLPPPSPSLSRSPVRTFAIPKTRSTGNLVIQNAPEQFNPAFKNRGYSFDAGGGETGSESTSPILRDHDHGITPSGLHRIRQQPPSRQISLSEAQSRSSSITINPPSPNLGANHQPGPITPLLTTAEDLMRFPSESLHSFSFAQKTDDFMHTRSNVLKRTYDFMRDRGLWTAGGLGIANAQAKVSGDQEVQSMMDLLSKANLLPSDASGARPAGFQLGPITGPALVSTENVFERSFFAQSESPTQLEPPQESIEEIADPQGDSAEPIVPLSKAPSLTVEDASEVDNPSTSSFTAARSDRPALTRTYTDTAPLSIQSKLSDALAQPYLADDSTLLSPVAAVAAQGNNTVVTTPFPGHQPHAHGRAGAPTSQAIFTTESQPPWTISAANDLACLVFGVTNAELRKIGIFEMIREDKRKWLEHKLSPQKVSGQVSPRTSPPPKPKTSSVMGNGVTARLLSRPSSRETGQGRRTKSDDGSGSSILSRRSAAKASPNHHSNKSRGVLLCGDVLPILKRNGAVGSATLWVQEKRGGLIWVMEEIAEDIAYLSLDEIGCVASVSGQYESIWGMERVSSGMDVARLVPGIPRLKGTNTGALDYDMISELRGFTARTANDISIPVTVDRLSGEATLRVSSFPHIAGMMVLSSSTLKISSCNSVVSEALFGRVPNGLRITDLIPGFDNMLNLLVQEDQVQLIEGMVIPEHSFRRARSMLALREGRQEAAAVFLRPSGLPAIHRDGAQIMIDVQMRVVKSESFTQDYSDTVIEEKEEGDDAEVAFPPSESVYALWVTYSRSLHASNHGVGPISPLVSRPGTPPQQPTPGSGVIAHMDESDSEHSDAAKSRANTASGTISTNAVEKAASTSEKDSSSSPSTVPDTPRKKSISDFVILEDMGAGAYGQVKLARPKASPSKKVVIKYVTKKRILVDTWTRDRRLGTVPLEIHVLDYLRRDGFKHPNIVEMSDFFEDDINYYIEMVPHGLPGMDLFDYIELRVNMEEEECRRIFTQVASAIEFLHLKAKVVHRDIKDENVILDGEGRIKLIDFGSASYIKNGPFDVFVGTIDYAAPEVLAGKPYLGPAQDIWALGILLYTILYKENPFYSIDEIMDLDLRVPYIVSESSIDLVRLMLERDVDRRIDISEVVRHPWCTSVAGEGDVDPSSP